MYYLPALLWALGILGLSVNNPPALPKFDLLQPDKIGHFLAYLGLCGWLIWGYYRQNARQAPLALIILFFMLSAGYGYAIEWIQAGLPHRSFDYADMLANALGAALAAVLGRWLPKTR